MECGYKNLLVWQKAMELVRMVYQIAKVFPADERYALTDQLRREMRRRSSLRREAGRRPPGGPARGRVVSIPSNIAEGCGRASNKDYAHFLAIARGSLYETMTQIQVAQDQGYVASIDNVESLVNEVGRMLTALLRKYGAIHSTTTTSNYD